MAKGKAKIGSSGKGVSLAPPQPRSLRSRKRECPSDEISEADDAQASHHHQDSEENNTTVDSTLLQSHQSPLQESAVISTQQLEAAEPSCLTKQDPDTEEKHAETTNADLKDVTVKAFEEREETKVTNPNNDFQLKGSNVHSDNDADKGGKNKEEMTAEECNRSQTDQLHVFLPMSEEGYGTFLKEQLGTKENSQCNLERNQETSQGEPSNVCMADVKEIPKEAATGLPAKKKRRMGMCGLTERERSHFLQTQKRENGQNAPERVEMQMCNNTADHAAQEEMISSSPLSSSLSIPVGSITEQNKAERKLQSSQSGGGDRAETEVHSATSDGTGAVCDPGCSKGESCEVEGSTVPDPEQTGDAKSEAPAEEEEEELLGNQEQQKLERLTGEIAAEKPQEQIKDREDGSAVVDQSHAITSYSNPTKNEETENRVAIEVTPLLVNSATGTGDKRKEELTGDASDGAEAGATDTQSGGFNCGSVKLHEAAATPSGSERKDSCESDDEPGVGPDTVNTETPEISLDPFGSGELDYVSDSQLNTIVLTEDEVMEREEDAGSPDCHEDATDLICGLIRELSSLNRTVMATHRELENLRRSNKSSRSSTR